MITRSFRGVSPRACASAALFAAVAVFGLASPAFIAPANAQLVERTIRLAPRKVGMRHVRTQYNTGVCSAFPFAATLQTAGLTNAFQAFQSSAGRGDVMFGYINRHTRGQSCHLWQNEAFQASFQYNLASLPRGALIKRALLVPRRARGRGFRFVPNGVTSVCTVRSGDTGNRRGAGPRVPALEVGLIVRRGWRGGYTFRDNLTSDRTRLMRDTLPYQLPTTRRVSAGGRSAFDVTRIVTAWHLNQRPNMGLVLTPKFPPALNEIAFDSVNQRSGRTRINHCLSVIGPPVLEITVLMRSGS